MNQKGFAPILILLGIVFILAVAGGAFYVGKIVSTPPEILPVITPTPKLFPTSIISPTSIIDETANLKTYSNEKYKISFKYPPLLSPCLGLNYPQDEGDKLEVCFSTTGKEVHLKIVVGLNKETNIGGLGSPLMHEVNKGTIQVGGMEANYSIAEMDPDEKGVIINGYFVNIKDKNILIDYGGIKDQTNMKEFKKILSSFKFLD